MNSVLQGLNTLSNYKWIASTIASVAIPAKYTGEREDKPQLRDKDYRKT